MVMHMQGSSLLSSNFLNGSTSLTLCYKIQEVCPSPNPLT